MIFRRLEKGDRNQHVNKMAFAVHLYNQNLKSTANVAASPTRRDRLVEEQMDLLCFLTFPAKLCLTLCEAERKDGGGDVIQTTMA